MHDAIESIRKNWEWFLASGIALVIIGFVALGSSIFTTLFTIAFLGVLLLIAGGIEIFYSFWARKWGGFFLQLITGLLYLVTGALLIWKPATAAIGITLLMALLFIVSGFAKIIGSLYLRFHDWIWVLLSGVISLALGGLILAEWPESGLWVIGMFVGIDLIFHGWAWIILALSSKRLPTE